MEYFILTSDTALPFVYGAAQFRPFDPGNYSNLWQDGKLPAGSRASITLINSVKRLRRDWFAVNAGFVGSRRLLEVLAGFQARFAAVSAEIYYHSGEPAAGEYFFLEFDCWVDAFDYEQSSFILDEASKVIECASLRIHAPKTQGQDIFFLLNVDCFEPVVSRRLADALTREGISGFKLVPSAEFAWSE